MRLRFTDEQKRTLTTAAAAFVANKILVLTFTVVAVQTQSLWKDRSLFGVLHYVFVDNFRYFDASAVTGYVGIAANGYETGKMTAFFPGYPLLMKAASWVLHISPLAAGVLISHVAFFLLLYYFLKLARVDYDWAASTRAVVLLALFPTAFYFSAAYTEATFMLVSVLALLGMRSGRWWRAGVWGGMASAVRNSGVFLGLPFLLEYWMQMREKRAAKLMAPTRVRPEMAGVHPAATDRRPDAIEQTLAPPERATRAVAAHGRGQWWPLAWVVVIGLGLVAYMAYLWATTGDPLSFARYQKDYGRGTGTPWGTLFHGYVYGFRVLANLHLPLDWNQIYYISQLFFPTVVLVVLVASFRRMRWSYWVIILYSLVFPLLAPADAGPELQSKVVDYFVSFARYSLVIVPLYFGLERLLRNRWAFAAFAVFSAAFLCLLTYAWSRHWWVA